MCKSFIWKNHLYTQAYNPLWCIHITYECKYITNTQILMFDMPKKTYIMYGYVCVFSEKPNWGLSPSFVATIYGPSVSKVQNK